MTPACRARSLVQGGPGGVLREGHQGRVCPSAVSSPLLWAGRQSCPGTLPSGSLALEGARDPLRGWAWGSAAVTLGKLHPGLERTAADWAPGPFQGRGEKVRTRPVPGGAPSGTHRGVDRGTENRSPRRLQRLFAELSPLAHEKERNFVEPAQHGLDFPNTSLATLTRKEKCFLADPGREGSANGLNLRAGAAGPAPGYFQTKSERL